MRKSVIKCIPLALLTLFFLTITIFFYWGIDKVYFQQDEWFKTGKSIYFLYASPGELLTRRVGFHFYPFLSIFFILQYLIFKLNVSLYLYTSIFLQILVAVFLFTFLKKIFGNTLIALLLSVLFLINPGIHQVILNEMVSTSYKIPLLLMLTEFIILWNTIRKPGTLRFKTLIIISALYLVSVAFFEGSFVLLILLPAFFVLFKSKEHRVKLSRSTISIFVAVIVISIARLWLQNKLPVDAPLPIQGSFIISSIYNAITMPPKFLVEYLFGLSNLLYFANIYTNKIFSVSHEPGINLGLIEITTAYEIVVYYMTSVLLLVTSGILLLGHKRSKAFIRGIRIIIFSLLWLAVNAIIIAPQGRVFTSVDSRYLYISGIGVLMLVGAIILIIWDRYKKNFRAKLCFVLLLLVYFFFWGGYSYNSIQKEKKTAISVSKVRKHVIDQFIALYPTLPDTAVFYVYCSDDCTSNELYGLPKSWVLPFQNGFGWTLLTIYSTENPKKYAPFFSNYLFWDNKSEGYRKIRDTSFGFFTNLNELKKSMKENSLIPSEITVLKYESRKYKLTKVQDSLKILFPKISTQ